MLKKNLLSISFLILVCTLCGCYTNLMKSGHLYEQMGDYSSAIVMYEEAVKNSNVKKRAAAQVELGRLYIKFGKYWEAEELLKEAANNLTPNDPNYEQLMYNLGYCYYEMGDLWANAAITAFEKALKVNDGFSKAHLYLAVLFYKAAEYKKAISHLDKVTDEENKAQALYMAGMSHWKLIDYTKANQKLIAAVEAEKNPDLRNKYQQMAVRLANEQRDAERKGKKIVDVKLADVFASIYQFYDENPIGNITIRNPMDKTLQDVKVSVFVDIYMDAPKVHSVKNLSPKEGVDLPITAKFNPKILNVKGEPESKPISLKLEYIVDSKKEEESKSGEYITIHGRNAMKWSEEVTSPENYAIAAFITPQSPAVEKFARAVSTADKPLEKAIQIYDALYLLGINYLRDPSNPYVGEGVDNIYYPHETLQSKKGDCDDLTVLYASCLQSVGIETAVLLPEGHIFVAFDSGLSPSRARRVIQDEDLFKVKSYEDKSTGKRVTKVWIPVEVTMLGRSDTSFFEAWVEGVQRFRREDLEPIPVSQAWQIYKPAWSGEEIELQLPEPGAISHMYYEDIITKAEKHWMDTLGESAKMLEDDIKENKVTDEDDTINRLGILYAKMNDFERAEKLFRQAAQKAPSKASYWNNLANVLLLMGNIEEADKYYQRAEEQGEGDAYIYFNRAIFYSAQRNTEKATQAIREAKKKSSKIYQVLQEELGIITGEGRAADENVASKFDDIMSNWDDKKQRLVKIDELLQELAEGMTEEERKIYRAVLRTLTKEEMAELLKLDKQQILEKLTPPKPTVEQPKISEIDIRRLIEDAIGQPLKVDAKGREEGISEPEDLRWWLSWLR